MYEKWRQTHIALKKAADNFIDMDALFATSTGHPIGHNNAKEGVGEAA